MLPNNIKPTIDFRYSAWINEVEVSEQFYEIQKKYNITNAIVNSDGWPDLLHIRLTTTTAFIRNNGANH